MKFTFSPQRRTRRTKGIIVGVSAVVALGLGGSVATASASPNSHREAPRASTAIPNLDTVKSQIRSFFGDHVDATGEHEPSQDSQWAREVNHVDGQALNYIKNRVAKGAHKPALVLDIDDTSLTTYTFGADRDFDMHNDPAALQAAAEFAIGLKLTAIPATRTLANWADTHGVSVFYVSDRPQVLQQASIDNLNKEGFPAGKGVFLPPTDESAEVFKSTTRAHIEDMGFDILANVGDQFTDLQGGHADTTYKLPNPMYTTP